MASATAAACCPLRWPVLAKFWAISSAHCHRDGSRLLKLTVATAYAVLQHRRYWHAMLAREAVISDGCP